MDTAMPPKSTKKKTAVTKADPEATAKPQAKDNTRLKESKHQRKKRRQLEEESFKADLDAGLCDEFGNYYSGESDAESFFEAQRKADQATAEPENAHDAAAEYAQDVLDSHREGRATESDGEARSDDDRAVKHRRLASTVRVVPPEEKARERERLRQEMRDRRPPSSFRATAAARDRAKYNKAQRKRTWGEKTTLAAAVQQLAATVQDMKYQQLEQSRLLQSQLQQAPSVSPSGSTSSPRDASTPIRPVEQDASQPSPLPELCEQLYVNKVEAIAWLDHPQPGFSLKMREYDPKGAQPPLVWFSRLLTLLNGQVTEHQAAQLLADKGGFQEVRSKMDQSLGVGFRELARLWAQLADAHHCLPERLRQMLKVVIQPSTEPQEAIDIVNRFYDDLRITKDVLKTLTLMNMYRKDDQLTSELVRKFFAYDAFPRLKFTTVSEYVRLYHSAASVGGRRPHHGGSNSGNQANSSNNNKKVFARLQRVEQDAPARAPRKRKNSVSSDHCFACGKEHDWKNKPCKERLVYQAKKVKEQKPQGFRRE